MTTLHPTFCQAAPGLPCTSSPFSPGAACSEKGQEVQLPRGLPTTPWQKAECNPLWTHVHVMGHKGLYVPIKQNSCKAFAFQYATYGKMLPHAQPSCLPGSTHVHATSDTCTHLARNVCLGEGEVLALGLRLDLSTHLGLSPQLFSLRDSPPGAHFITTSQLLN